MDESFIVLNKQESVNSFLKSYRRIELINSICNDTELSHLTEYPNIVKLCRLCIQDICLKLKELSNIEADTYNTYKLYYSSLEEKDLNLVADFEKEMKKTKLNYQKYINLYEKMTKYKLYTKGCVICKQTKTDNTDKY
jgi:hypothetical protein